jgi:kumamolisin
MDTGSPQRSSQKKRLARFLAPRSFIPFVSITLIMIMIVWYLSPLDFLRGAQAASLDTIGGQIPQLVHSSQISGDVNSSATVTIAVGLRLRNESGLEQYVKSISQASNRVKRTLTTDQLIRAYAPLPSDEQAVINYMQQFGFKTTETFKTHTMIGFSGTIGQAEQAFHVQIKNYRSPQGRTFYAPTANPSVPMAIAPFIQSISGLDTAALPTRLPISKPASQFNAVTPNAVSCPGQFRGTPSAQNPLYYLPSQLATAYNLQGLYNQGYNGEGQTVALVEFSDYSSSDVSAYASCYGGSQIPVTRVPVNGGTTDMTNAFEDELDIELLMSAAPKLAGIRVYEASATTLASFEANYLLIWQQIVNDAVPVVSTSWGVCETQLGSAAAQQEEQLLLMAAAQGQTVLAASGDYGSDGCGTGSSTLSADDPAAQPFVTGVGGTSLTLDSNNNYSSETTWNIPSGATTPPNVASGGGISQFWTQPSWQAGPGVTNSYSSGTPCTATSGNCREVPDVALLSDVNYVVYCTVTATGCSSSTPWNLAGGTSAAAPMWAAFIALANEKSLHDGDFILGFLNPMLYQILQNATQYANDFHDVTTGNNNLYGNPQYPATSGYDMATGLGSYNAANLAADLEQINASATGPRTAPANTTWYFAEGSVGGSFSEFLTVLNPSPTQDANVTVTYLFENKAPQIVTHVAPHSVRTTISANTDLGVSASSTTSESISAIVTSNVPVVVERPMYFNFFGIASGTDVLGATNANQTTFYFAEGDARHNSSQSYSTFVTMLNPSQTATANVTITYYANGNTVGTQNLAVGPQKRGTTSPSDIGITSQVAIKVTSDIGIVVERPLYFRDNFPNAGGLTTGASSAVGATTLGNPTTGSDWLFAEGNAVSSASGSQENLVLANFTTSSTTATVKLEYTNGTTQSVGVAVPALSQVTFDVNNANANPVANCGCTPTTSVSAEVTSPTASIVAERVMYFHFGTQLLSGGTDVVGEVGPSSNQSYAFAEGSTGQNFYEFITLQNPNSQAETVVLTMYADHTIVQQAYDLKPTSRTTIGINPLEVPMANAYPGPGANDVSIDIQALNGTVVAERPMYFNFFSSTGGTDVLGYTGN